MITTVQYRTLLKLGINSFVDLQKGEKMGRLIDADLLLEVSNYEFYQDASAITPIGEHILFKFRNLIRNFPSAQPEIIRCKDCKKHNVEFGIDENRNMIWKEDACPLIEWRGEAQGHEFDYQYCVYAERREDG